MAGRHSSREGRPLLTVAAFAAGLVLVASAVTAVVARSVGGLEPDVAVKPASVAAPAKPETATASVPATTEPAPSAEPTEPPVAEPLSTPVTPKPKPAAPAPDPVVAYRGLGMWVDIWDDRAWRDPAAAVRDMKAHGVKTLYLETANSRQPYAVKDPAKTATFIRTAHANGMKVVAWYLCDMTDVDKDFGRMKAAVDFRTNDGQKFDSFALDIESPAVKSQSQRNANLEKLSRRIRAHVGPKYPLGAITPSPVGLSRAGSYWSSFPWGMVAEVYDVFVPMSYYTWHGEGNKAAYDDTVANMRILRSKPGCANEPIHLIGGIAEESSPSETKAFVQAANATNAIGASFYTWDGVNASHWQQLAGVR